MSQVLDDPCRAAVQRALEIAELCLKGDLPEIDVARVIAKLASFDCYDFLDGGFELVDLMGEFAAPIYVLDVDEPDEKEKAEISREIRRALSEFVVQAKDTDG
jgi:hypothetical protein